MRVHIERHWQRGTVRVHVLVERGFGGRRVLTRPEPGEDPFGVGFVEREVKPEDTPDSIPPLLELPEDVFAAIVAAGTDVLPPDRAQASHLADAITVRDRLLALVERPTP